MTQPAGSSSQWHLAPVGAPWRPPHSGWAPPASAAPRPPLARSTRPPSQLLTIPSACPRRAGLVPCSGEICLYLCDPSLRRGDAERLRGTAGPRGHARGRTSFLSVCAGLRLREPKARSLAVRPRASCRSERPWLPRLTSQREGAEGAEEAGTTGSWGAGDVDVHSASRSLTATTPQETAPRASRTSASRENARVPERPPQPS